MLLCVRMKTAKGSPATASSEMFTSPTFGRLTLEQVIEHMLSFQQKSSEHTYRILLGTDSLPSAEGNAVLVTALVFHRQGNGAIYFLRKQKFAHLVTLRQRMYQEALTSIDVAKLFLQHPRSKDLLAGDIEIHVDIGHNGPTRDMIREIVGMVKANGFPVKTKPDSVAASTVADRHTVFAKRS